MSKKSSCGTDSHWPKYPASMTSSIPFPYSDSHIVKDTGVSGRSSLSNSHSFSAAFKTWGFETTSESNAMAISLDLEKSHLSISAYIKTSG